MKWFKHFTNAHNDNALRKVRMRYGAEGYALYWFCLELIAGDLDGENATFELSHDAEVIGHDLRIDQMRVEEMMRYMVSLGLFESSNNVITCLKIAKFLDKKTTRNPEIIRLINKSEASGLSATVGDLSATSPDLSATVPDLSPIVRTRLDKIRLDNINTSSARSARSRSAERSAESDQGFAEFWQAYPRKVGKLAASKAWAKVKDRPSTDHLIEMAKRQFAAVTDAKYFPHASTWLNGRRWEDYEAPTDTTPRLGYYL